MLTREQGYKDQTIAAGHALVAWQSGVTSAARVGGYVHSDAEVTLELWALRPRTNPPLSTQGTVVATEDLGLGSTWHLIEGPLTIAAGDTEPYSWAVDCGYVQLLVHASAEATATVDVEVNSRSQR